MKVLVVDDQQINRSLLHFMLSEDGYDVQLAENGEEALAVYDTFLPDLVLLDVMMPVMDGFEAAPLLKQKAGDLYLPIIFITALDDQASLLRCLEVGGDDFLNKPFDKVILAAKIRAHKRTRELSLKTNEQNKILEYHQNVVNREHEIVDHIFSNALNHNDLNDKVIDFHLSPASMFNGDLFLVTKSEVGNTCVLMGDFTGHGLAAAIGALPVSKVFYSMAKKGMSVGDMAYEINQTLRELLPDHMFCAANIVEFSATGKNLSIWSGGLPDALLLDTDNSLKSILPPQHMALGILEDDEFERTTTYLETKPGEKIVLYTDGVTEAENSDGEMYGDERFISLFEKPNEHTVDSIISQLSEFSSDTEQADDISLIMVTCAESDTTEQEVINKHSNVPFNVLVELCNDQLKTCDPVVDVLNMISTVEGITEHRSSLFMLLSEVYNNALEHGVLGLDSAIKDQEDGFFEFYQAREVALESLVEASITINATYLPAKREITFCVEHSGEGFDHEAQTEKLDTYEEGEQEHGRGLMLVKELADSFVFAEEGRQVVLSYKLV